LKQSIKNINDIAGFLSVIDDTEELNNASDTSDLIQHLKNLKTEDVALQGAILFLEECDWDFNLLKESLISVEDRIDLVHKQSKNITSMRKVYRYAVAAAVVIPILFFSIHKWSSQTISIADYLIAEPGLPNFMANSDFDKWNTSMCFFKRNDHQKVLEEFSLMQNDQNNDTLIYFSAVSNYYLGNFQEAKRQFEKISLFENSSFRFDADFRLGFVLFRLGKTDEASLHFKRIASNKDHAFKDESKTVLHAFFSEHK